MPFVIGSMKRQQMPTPPAPRPLGPSPLMQKVEMAQLQFKHQLQLKQFGAGERRRLTMFGAGLRSALQEARLAARADQAKADRDLRVKLAEMSQSLRADLAKMQEQGAMRREANAQSRFEMGQSAADKRSAASLKMQQAQLDWQKNKFGQEQFGKGVGQVYEDVKGGLGAVAGRLFPAPDPVARRMRETAARGAKEKATERQRSKSAFLSMLTRINAMPEDEDGYRTRDLLEYELKARQAGATDADIDKALGRWRPGY